MKHCELCGIEFQGHRKEQRFCSVACFNSSRPSNKRPAVCAGCGNDFTSRNRGGGRGWTKFCSNTCRGKNLGFKGGPKASRHRRRYGIEPEEYAALLTEQGLACAICRKSVDYDLYVDHNHETGAVRSLLCAKCNNAVSVFDRLTWDEVLMHWGYANYHAEGKALARALAIACQESGNVPTLVPQYDERPAHE